MEVRLALQASPGIGKEGAGMVTYADLFSYTSVIMDIITAVLVAVGLAITISNNIKK